MFKRSLTIFALLAFLTASSIYYTCFYLLPKDIKAYEKALKKEETRRSKEKKLTDCEQYRSKVTKEIWTPSTKGRHYTLIQADNSTLLIKQSKTGVKLEEHLEEIFCLTQEKFFKTKEGNVKQQVKTLQSNQGIYHFSDKSFSCDRSMLRFYTLDGTLPPALTMLAQPAMEGIVKNAMLSFKEHDLMFKAEGFYADVTCKEILK